MVPGITVLQAMLRSAEEAATRLDVETTAGGVHNATEIEHVIKSFAQKPNGGLVGTSYVVTVFNASRIIAMARQNQLPDIYALAEFVLAGGLVSYGLDWDDQFRRAAGNVDEILRGNEPVGLPVQASTKFELTINMNTAKALGLTVPPSLLSRADTSSKTVGICCAA